MSREASLDQHLFVQLYNRVTSIDSATALKTLCFSLEQLPSFTQPEMRFLESKVRVQAKALCTTPTLDQVTDALVAIDSLLSSPLISNSSAEFQAYYEVRNQADSYSRALFKSTFKSDDPSWFDDGNSIRNANAAFSWQILRKIAEKKFFLSSEERTLLDAMGQFRTAFYQVLEMK
jgi:hypothetical protein